MPEEKLLTAENREIIRRLRNAVEYIETLCQSPDWTFSTHEPEFRIAFDARKALADLETLLATPAVAPPGIDPASWEKLRLGPPFDPAAPGAARTTGKPAG